MLGAENCCTQAFEERHQAGGTTFVCLLGLYLTTAHCFTELLLHKLLLGANNDAIGETEVSLKRCVRNPGGVLCCCSSYSSDLLHMCLLTCLLHLVQLVAAVSLQHHGFLFDIIFCVSAEQGDGNG